MKIINLMAPVLATTWLAGCVTQPGEEPIEENGEVQISETEASAPAGSEEAERAIALDARAAALAEHGALAKDTTITPASLTSSWYTGTVAAGATQHWYWNNASHTVAFQVGLSPVGASTANPCTFEVTRTWDVENYGGEREFHFEIKNISSIACGANILLASKTRVSTWNTNGIAVGQSKSYTWNNASPVSFFVGVSPSGATSTSPCEIEVTRTYYVQQPSGENEFHFTVKNIGAIACSGDIQLALTSDQTASWISAGMNPGASTYWLWNNTPLSRVYVPGLVPLGASGLTPCQLEVTRSYYRQVINSDGTPEREFRWTVSNVGSLACLGEVLLNYLD